MRVRINTREITLPDNKSEVTLGQRLDFQTEHGDLLDKMADSISKMEDAPDKEVEVLEFYFEKVFRVFSFFSGVPVDDLRDGRHIDKILFFYNASLAACVEPRADTLELREFLYKNKVPHKFEDIDEEAGREALRALDLTPEQAPVIACSKGFIARPTLPEFAEALGI